MPPWKAKVALQHAFSGMPRGHELNYRFQRHVTRSLPISGELLAAGVELAVQHLAGLRKWSSLPIEEGRFFEFGAGWDLHVPQALYCLGVSRQLEIDLGDFIRADLVVEAGARLGRPEFAASGFQRLPPREPVPFDAYLEELGIDYRAPCDARQTGLASGSIDFITSTSTLEHIPPVDLARILDECRRIVNDDGALSFFVDYRDHYSYFDPRLSVYNYLKFDDRRWKRYNPGLQYQNRLRHSDYLALFRDAGFAVREVAVGEGSPGDLQLLEDLPIDRRFSGYPIAELAIQDARFVLTKADTSVATT
jgi:SAM-dependent methyltransferase